MFGSSNWASGLLTSGTLCSHIPRAHPSGRGGCREPDGGSSSGRDERSLVEGKTPTRLLLSRASTRPGGQSVSLSAWKYLSIWYLSWSSVQTRFTCYSFLLCIQSYLLRPSFLARSRLDRSCRQQMRKDRDMARMTTPLTTEAKTATRRPRSSGLGIAAEVKKKKKKKKSQIKEIG